jgi:tetratricopeptide (TPR) repeat protein
VLAGERIEEAFSGNAREHPEEGVAWFRLGLVQRRLGRYAEAHASISRAWTLARHPSAAAELGRLDDLLRRARLP